MTVRRLITRLLIVVITLAALVVGGAWVYATFINDAPEEFDITDLEQRLTDATIADQAPTQTSLTVVDDTANSPTDSEIANPSERWVIAEGSEVGYRVAEVLFGIDTEGVGRTEEVTGELSLAGTSITSANFTVDVASMQSDDNRRDGQFRGRIMETDTFPTASFTLTNPVDLGVEAREGAAVTTTIEGQLTMHGVTNDVTVQVAAQVEGGRLGVIGSIPVIFADFGILDPSINAIKVQPEGLVEFVLIFSQQ